MSGDQSNPGAGGVPGVEPQDSAPAGQQGTGAARRPAVDPAAVADQLTQLDGAPIPAQAAGPAPAQPSAAPAAPADISYQPTAPAFPAQAQAPAAQAPAAPAPAPAAPSGPPPSSYGAPIGPYDPQAAPSYGYPQAPPPVYAPQQGFGQGGPTPDQGGYGAPQYNQQAGYGYPGPVMAPPPVAKQRNPVLIFGAVAGSVLAIAIVIGLIVLMSPNTPAKPSASGGVTGGATSGGSTGGGGTTAGQLNAAWTVPKSTASGSDSHTLGEWTTDKLFVRGDATGLTGYNMSNGQVAWTLTPPAGTKAICSMSENANSKYIGGISFNLGDDDCSAVGAVDATTGKLLFKVGGTLPQKSFDTQLTVTDTTVAAASSGVLGGFSLTDGHALWTYKDRGEFCNDSSDTADSVVVVSDFCPDATPKQQVSVLNADTGQITSSFPLTTDNDRLTNIVSTKPLVLQISSGYDNDYLLGFDATGKPMAKIPLKVAGEDRLQLSSASAALSKDMVLGNTLYVEVSQSDKTAIRAIDLVSGTTLWTVDGGAEQGLRLASGSKDGKPLVIAMDGFGKGARLVTLAPADGSLTNVYGIALKSDSFMPFQDAQVLVSTDDTEVLTVPQLPIEASATLYSKS
ncbi:MULTISPECIES: PQQ-binding-like beta-propeller repeat protein [unclassified Kitasatospora]|uniref:outer membrane protein assembly factor BamB family protein n=1 Tax=unclassified Kitasatospora TaxID=2633591 RepID=UPI00247489EF|nr:PQQ-binding-like beta-propeller repeat protein [Kitasatospora sp. MAP12-44]